jgi:aldehyde dehydrogenase (NAD+)
MSAEFIPFRTDQVFIDGQWNHADGRQTFPAVDPSTGRTFAEIARGGPSDIDRAVAAARRALKGPWGRMSAAERGRVLHAMSRMVLDNLEMLARIECADVGKPLRQARVDAGMLARYLEFYAGATDKLHGETIPFETGYTVLTLREPHGVTAHIIPWNYPMQIIGRSVGGALASGNAAVLKPATEACLSALAFARIAHDAGLPAGALNVVPGPGGEVGTSLAAHPGINHISFTGSFATGRLIQAAAAGNVVPVALELGGKSPQLVFADADLDAALPFLVNAGIQNAGQTCTASSRILVQRPVFDELVARMAERYRALKVGPAPDDHDVGPLVSARQRDIVTGYLAPSILGNLSVTAQSTIVSDAPRGGYYVNAALVAGVPKEHRLSHEEIFGPVQVVTAFDTEEEAIEMANGTEYGLVAGVWTRDGGRQLRLARAIEAGQVFVNNYGAGGGVELPFGGVKHSGHGREKGFEALYSFTKVKTVAIRHG